MPTGSGKKLGLVEENAAMKLQMVMTRWDEQSAAALASRQGVEILVDYASPDTFWSQDGFTFGPGPQLAGDLLPGACAFVPGICIENSGPEIRNLMTQRCILVPGGLHFCLCSTNKILQN